MIKAGQLRQGGIITYNGQLCEVLEAQHHKPGKGGAFVRAKLKNLSSGSIISESLRPEETFEEAFIEQKQMQYLYRDEHYNFMDSETYEQIPVSKNHVKDNEKFLIENKTDVLISLGVGEGAYYALKEHGVEMYQPRGIIAGENITNFVEGRLSRLEVEK